MGISAGRTPESFHNPRETGGFEVFNIDKWFAPAVIALIAVWEIIDFFRNDRGGKS